MEEQIEKKQDGGGFLVGLLLGGLFGSVLTLVLGDKSETDWQVKTKKAVGSVLEKFSELLKSSDEPSSKKEISSKETSELDLPEKPKPRLFFKKSGKKLKVI